MELSPEDVPWGEPAFLLIGALSHSDRFRGAFCEQMTFGHLAEAIHRVLVALGGTSRVWRTDRMATIVVPGTDRLTVEAAQMAKPYGVEVAVCPPRRAQRKRSRDQVHDPLLVAHRAGHDHGRSADVRWTGGARRSPISASARPGPSARPAPRSRCGRCRIPPTPAVIRVERKASRHALVAFEANQYSVPPAHAGRTVTIHARAGDQMLRIVPAAGEVVATHRRAPAGAGQTVRSPEHAGALEQAVLQAFTTDTACRRKANRPPGEGALAELARLHGLKSEHEAVVVSLADYAALAEATR